MIYIWLIIILWLVILGFRIYLDYKFITAPFYNQSKMDKIKNLISKFDYIILGALVITVLLICSYFIFPI